MKFQTFFVQTAWRLLLLLFLYTALEKILDFSSFATKLAAQPTGPKLAPFFSYAVPAIELGIAILLLFESTRQVGVMAAIVLLLIFTIYVTLITLGAFERVPCTCAGIIESMSWTGHLIFNSAFLILSILTLKFYNPTDHHFPYTHPRLKGRGGN